MNPQDLVSGEREFIITISIGTAASGTVVKHTTIIKKLNKVVKEGDPQFEIILEHGEKRFGWKRFGLLCSFYSSFGKILTAAAENTSLIDMNTLHSSTSMLLVNPHLVANEENDTPSPRTDFSYTTTDEHSNHPSRNTLFVSEDALAAMRSNPSSTDTPLLSPQAEATSVTINTTEDNNNNQNKEIDEEIIQQRSSRSINVSGKEESGQDNIMELMTMTGRDYETVMSALTLFNSDQNLVVDYLLQQQEN